MIVERAEVTVIRGEFDARHRETVDAFLASINRAFGVGQNEPRKEGVAKAAQELADAPMTRRPKF